MYADAFTVTSEIQLRGKFRCHKVVPFDAKYVSICVLEGSAFRDYGLEASERDSEACSTREWTAPPDDARHSCRCPANVAHTRQSRPDSDT